MIIGNFIQAPWDAQPVTPSDSASPATPAKAEGATPQCIGVYNGGAPADIAIKFDSGSVVTFKAVPTGVTIYGRISRVMATNTTATLMVALYTLA